MSLILLMVGLVAGGEVRERHKDGRIITIKESCNMRRGDNAAVLYYVSKNSPTISKEGLQFMVSSRLNSRHGKHIERVYLCVE
jgi:hypothetical protein